MDYRSRHTHVGSGAQIASEGVTARKPGMSPHGRGGALRVAIVDNPRSGRNLRRNPVAGQASRHPGLRIREVVTPGDVKEALFELTDQPPELVIVNGGDGTAQSVMAVLLEYQPYPHQPLIAILPAGTTNMTAGDVGLRGNRLRALNRLLDWAEHPDPGITVKSRHVLRVRSPLDTDPLYGMFFGASAILQGIRYCRQKIHTKGIRGELGPGLAMARLVWETLAGGSRHLRSEPVTLTVDDGPTRDYDSLVLLVSSLDRLLLGLRPFWNSAHGAVHLTLIRNRPHHLMRVLPALVRGHPHPDLIPENGYLSQGIRELRLSLDGGFTLDGELHASDSTRGPLVIDSGGELNFVQP